MVYPNAKLNPSRPNGGSNRSFQQPRPQEPVPDFPEDYVDFADKQMFEYMDRKDHDEKGKEIPKIKTSKIRKILGMLMEVYNTENLRRDEQLLEESVVKIQMARIRIAYECGREQEAKSFKLFVNEMHLLPWLKTVGKSREAAIRYIHYLEALVAYHRFYGGREN